MKKEMSIRREQRYQTMADLERDEKTVIRNQDSDAIREIMPETTMKGTPYQQTKRKRTVSVGLGVFAVLIVMCSWFFIRNNYYSLSDMNGRKNMIHIQFAPNKKTDPADYEKDKQALRERLDIFANGSNYIFEETDDCYDVYLPSKCFGDARIENVCRTFLSSAGQLYFVDKEDEQQVFPVEILPQYIESITENAVNEDTIDGPNGYLNVTLNNEGQLYYAEKLSEFRSFTICRDVLEDPGSYKPVYYTYTSNLTKEFPNTERSFSIWGKDFFPTELELTEYFLTKDSLEHHFDFSIEYPVAWEPSGSSGAGENQVDVTDLEDNDLVAVFQNPQPETGETILEVYKEIKNRCDTLGRPYAFGTVDDYGSFAIKMPSEGLSYPVFKLLVSRPESLDLRIGSWTIPTEAVTDIVVEEEPFGSELVRASINDDEICEKLRLLSMDNPDLKIYLSARCMTDLLPDDLYLFQGTIGEAFDGGELSLKKSCFSDYLDVQEDDSWPFELFRAVNESINLPIAYNVSLGNGNTQTEKVLEETLKNSNLYHELLNDIKQFAPNAEIQFPDEIEDSSDEVYIQLNLDVNDELPYESLDVARKIYDQIDLSNSQFNALQMVFAEEEDKTDEWARVLFRKCPVESLEERNKNGSMGAFLNGRFSPYQRIFRDNLLNSAFYRELGKNYQYYFSTSQGESGWSFSHTIHTSGIHYSVR